MNKRFSLIIVLFAVMVGMSLFANLEGGITGMAILDTFDKYVTDPLDYYIVNPFVNWWTGESQTEEEKQLLEEIEKDMRTKTSEELAEKYTLEELKIYSEKGFLPIKEYEREIQEAIIYARQIEELGEIQRLPLKYYDSVSIEECQPNCPIPEDLPLEEILKATSIDAVRATINPSDFGAEEIMVEYELDWTQFQIDNIKEGNFEDYDLEELELIKQYQSNELTEEELQAVNSEIESREFPDFETQEELIIEEYDESGEIVTGKRSYVEVSEVEEFEEEDLGEGFSEEELRLEEERKVAMEEAYSFILDIEDIDKQNSLLAVFVDEYGAELSPSQKEGIRDQLNDIIIIYTLDKTKTLQEIKAFEADYLEFIEGTDTELEYNALLDQRIDQLEFFSNNPSVLSEESRAVKIRVINDLEYVASFAETKEQREDAQKKITKLKDVLWRSKSLYEHLDSIYQGAVAGRYLAQKMGIEAFEWSEKFFQGTFGRFITGEPPAGVCDKAIRKAGDSQGVIIGQGLLNPLIAHIEGEKSVIEDPNGDIEYFYKITLQIKAKKEDEKITYNVELYKDNQLQMLIFKQSQNKVGNVNHVGNSAFIKYSKKDYDKLCLKSSAGNTCNRFADVSEFANVEATKFLPAASLATGTGTSPSTAASGPINEW